ncbi:MAG: hypothetical protein ACTHKQ_00970 [Mesorhizobium sp.]
MNLSNIILWPRRDHIGEELAAALELVETDHHVPVPPSILNRSASVVSSFLDHARAEEARLVNSIARLTEELRQTRLAVSAFEPALKILDEGYDPADDARKSYDVAIEAKRKRGKQSINAMIAAE